MTHFAAVDAFLQQHRLPASYAAVIEHYVTPIANQLAEQQRRVQRPLLVAINGCQGSGKTTLADALVLVLKERQTRAVAISIDDFYLTKNARKRLAKEIHPLLQTRGVPGTHDIVLANLTLDQLMEAHGSVAVPRFDKANDDRYPIDQWDHQQAPVEVIILEGWCVASPPQPESALDTPVNPLEDIEDRDGRWRHFANDQLGKSYAKLFDRFDVRIMLQAPSFDSVFQWRLEQENKLREKVGRNGPGIMSGEQIARFIQHYQRITTHTLKVLPAQVHFLLQMDEHRQIHSFTQPLALWSDSALLQTEPATLK